MMNYDTLMKQTFNPHFSQIILSEFVDLFINSDLDKNLQLLIDDSVKPVNFVRLLRCPENDLLRVRQPPVASATIFTAPCMRSNIDSRSRK